MPANPIALVTGGSRGLGRSTVEALAHRGVSSIFTFNQNRAAADEVVAAIQQMGAQAAVLPLDTGDSAAFPGFAAAVRQVLTGWGVKRFDFLVNNAGTSHHAPIAAVTEEDFDALYRVHLVPSRRWWK